MKEVQDNAYLEQQPTVRVYDERTEAINKKGGEDVGAHKDTSLRNAKAK
jgi:hypothetical protein